MVTSCKIINLLWGGEWLLLSRSTNLLPDLMEGADAQLSSVMRVLHHDTNSVCIDSFITNSLTIMGNESSRVRLSLIEMQFL